MTPSLQLTPVPACAPVPGRRSPVSLLSARPCVCWQSWPAREALLSPGSPPGSGSRWGGSTRPWGHAVGLARSRAGGLGSLAGGSTQGTLAPGPSHAREVSQGMGSHGDLLAAPRTPAQPASPGPGRRLLLQKMGLHPAQKKSKMAFLEGRRTTDPGMLYCAPADGVACWGL